MLTRITHNGIQLGHGSGLCAALNTALDNNAPLHPDTVILMYRRLHNGGCEIKDATGTWKVETEPALTAEMVRDWSKSGVKFKEVTT